MEATALSVGKSVLNGALGYAKSAFAEEVALQLGIQKDHTFVADELEMMRSFMMEAHEERDNSKVVKTWVKQVRDTAYDVEDSLQDFAVRLKRPSWWRFPRTLLERRRVAKQMKELRAKVEDVSLRNARYHLIKGSGSKAAATTAAEQSSAIAATIFGVDDARHASKQMNQRVDLVQLICMDDEVPKVIAVWGTSGDIGIASTIMEAYENPDVQDKFPGRAWVRVMHPFSLRGFVQSLVTEFQAAEGVEILLEIEDAEQDLAKKFNEYVNKKRCLIVLNDLSTIEEWNQIKKCFQNIMKGSRIIVSTMQVEVANLCAGQESQASELKRLSHDQTLYAFYKKGPQNEEDSGKYVCQRNVRYHLIKGSGSKAAITSEQSGLTAAAMYGIGDARRAAKQDNQRVDLVQLINKEDEDLQVIAVWGTSGDMGQTTIIREAYDNPDVQIKFPCRAWVRVMHPFIPKEFVQSLVNQLHATQGVEALLEREKTEQDLAQEFNEYVNDTKCLIVLNNLSTIEEWDQIKKCFPNNKKGSRIIVSSTQIEVASLCPGQDSQASELKQLSTEQTLYAFYDKGPQNEEDSGKPGSISDVATTSTGITTHAEIIDDQSTDANEIKKVATKNLTRIKTRVGAFEESQLIGRKKEMSEIIDLILNNESSQQVQVISVWGMGGLGKTTLVCGVYQSPMLSDKFEKYVFVTIVRPFNLKELLRSMAEQLQDESSKKEELLENRISSKKSLASMEVDKLTEQLRRLLENKTSLIVLDDFFKISEWDLIKPKLLPLLEKKSRIIVTTREEDIANHCSKKHGVVHNLQVLRPDDALRLLSEKVFDDAKYLDEQNDSNLLKEAKQILKKCGGLPLAIVVIGGLLANRPKTAQEWWQLNENINAELEMNPKLGMIRTVLEKGYDGLPYHLKSCFLYLSIFPEDENISQRRLVHRWAAEGYSSETHGKSAIEIADDYFMELKNRSMILPYQKSVHSRKSIDSCKVHDLMRDIAISKSTEENLVFRLEASSSNIHGAIRHLAISSNWKGDKSEFEGTVDLSRVRSLSLFGEWKPFFISNKMRFLRVLDFEGTNSALKYHHLDQIWKLIHLKFLSLRGCRGIGLLPDSLGNLRQLQILDVRGTFIEALPKTITKLQKLQHIHVGLKTYFIEEEHNSLPLHESCLVGACLCATCCLPLLCSIDGLRRKALTRRDACTFACCVKFPAVLTGADKERGAMVPRGIRKLKDLHTLREMNVGRGSNVLRDIEMLTGLRKLGVSGINKKNGRAFCSAISNLSRLESLSVSSAGKPGLCGCLDEISSPPENLQSLKVYGNLEKFPEWIKELQHLVKLKLVGTRLLEHDAAMEFLGKLPSLEILVLSLSRSSSQCEELDFKSSQGGIAFRNLRVLTLQVTGNIKSVKFDEGAMPKLERLEVTVMGRVNEIDFSGLAFLPNINEVLVRVSFHVDWGRIFTTPDHETQRKIQQEEEHEQRRKQGQLKKKIQEQLAQNTNEPIVTVDDYYYSIYTTAEFLKVLSAI